MRDGRAATVLRQPAANRLKRQPRSCRGSRVSTAAPAALAALADELERTMRAIGAWSEPAPPLVPFTKPFAMDTMPLEHWLQLVLVPRMRAIAADGEPMPPRSDLAAHAVREFDGEEDRMRPLFDVLRRID